MKPFHAVLPIGLVALGLVGSLEGAGKELAGRIEAATPDGVVSFPTLRVEVEADVRGDLASVAITQTFVNPSKVPMNAKYLFPLNEDAAVYEMRMEVGDELIYADIQEKRQARRTFEKAQRQGKAAALLEQHRPNMFTQEVANLMPGLPIRVTLKYVHPVKKSDADYRLVVPLVVGPRFQPPGAGVPPRPTSDAEPAGTETFGRWELEGLPPYPPVSGLDVPDVVEKDRVTIRVHLNAGMPLRSVSSATHPVTIDRVSPQEVSLRLRDAGAIDNRDFELSYRLGGESNQAGLLAYRDPRGGYFSLLIEPPAVPKASQITSREMVFVLDCSGSMSGLPMEASKAFMREALRGLRPSDSFRIIRFSDAATEFSRLPLPATPQNVRSGIGYTDRLRGSGGTMMTSGIRQALDVPVPRGSIRIVTFLTDGYIGNEQEVLRLVTERIGDARLFAFGVGTSVNRFLLEKMGRMGRGFTRYMDPTEEVEKVAGELAARLDSPVLTDIHIDWGELQPTELTPRRMPDLFAGQTLRLQGRYQQPGSYRITVEGRVNGREARLPLDVVLPESSAGGEAVALVWARSTIESLMDELIAPVAWRDSELTDAQVQKAVTELGLEFALVTRWTSFVAVSEKIVNQRPEDAVERDVPLPMVEGVTELAYPRGSARGETRPSGANPGLVAGPTGQTGSNGFSGGSTPEPATLGGLIVMTLMGGAALRRRRCSKAERR